MCILCPRLDKTYVVNPPVDGIHQVTIETPSQYNERGLPEMDVQFLDADGKRIEFEKLYVFSTSELGYMFRYRQDQGDILDPIIDILIAHVPSSRAVYHIHNSVKMSTESAAGTTEHRDRITKTIECNLQFIKDCQDEFKEPVIEDTAQDASVLEAKKLELKVLNEELTRDLEVYSAKIKRYRALEDDIRRMEE